VNKSLNNDIVRSTNNINLIKKNKTIKNEKKKKKKISNERKEEKNIIKSFSMENISSNKLILKNRQNDNEYIRSENNKKINNDDYNEKDFLNDEELNNLEYLFSIKYDKRTYFQYYCTFLKKTINFIFFFSKYRF
jgi:hypothetical protein